MEIPDNEEKLCLICATKADDDEPLISVTKKGVDTLIKSAALRNNISIKQQLESRALKNEQIFVHCKCRKKFTDKRSITMTVPTDEQSAHSDSKKMKRNTFSSTKNKFNWKSQCFFCEKNAFIDYRHKNKSVSFVKNTLLKKKIVKRCLERGDSMASKVHLKVGYTFDLKAVAARYHRSCYKKFMCQRITSNCDNIATNTFGRPKSTEKSNNFNELCIWLDKEGDLHTLKELYDKTIELANGCESVYTIKSLKQKLQEHYGDHITICEIDGKENIVSFRNTTNYLINKAYAEKKYDDPVEESRHILKMAANLIRTNIRDANLPTDKYPSIDGIKSITNNKEYIPSYLRLFLEELLSDEIIQCSIGQCLVKAVRPRSSLPPLLFSLGIEVDHIFGSKWMIDELAHLGYSISYKEVQRFKNCVVQNTDLHTLHKEISDGSFVQFAADNVDHNIVTLDGKGTFHGMGIISMTTGNELISNDSVIPRNKSIPTKDLIKNKGIEIKKYCNAGKPSLSILKFKEYKELLTTITIPKKLSLDIIWKLSPLITSLSQPRPFWSGFMELSFANSPKYSKSVIKFLPIIDLNPSDNDCIYSTLLFIEKQAKLCNKSLTPCITFDQPLWIKAVEIIHSNDLNIVCRLGGFHMLMSFLGSIGKVMENTGLAELLETIYGENTVKHMLEGKAISRALRGHFLLESALILNIAERNVDSFNLDIIKQIFELIDNKKDIEECINNPLFEEAKKCIEHKRKELSSQSRTAKLWNQYIDLVWIVKMFIFAEKTGDWFLHLKAVQKMLPIFAATGHNNYAKSGRLYLQLMQDLKNTHPDLYHHFHVNGYHCVRRRNQFWNGLWSDLIIEQVLMRSIKSSGGMTRGRGMTESVRTQWVLTMHIFAAIHEAMSNFTKTKRVTSHQHIELSDSRRNRDNNDLLCMLDCLDVYNPFYRNYSSLTNIFTGVTDIDNKVNCDEIETIGIKIMTKMDNIPYKEVVMKKHNQVITMKCLNNVISIGPEKISIDSSKLFSRLLMIADKSDLKELFKYELAPAPTSLFKDQMMRKNNKADLANYLINDNMLLEVVPGNSFYVLDGGSLLHRIKWVKNETYEAVINQYKQFINQYGKCFVVFDGYQSGMSTKDHEHTLRNKKSSTDINISLPALSHGNQQLFLANNLNKSKFIDILSDQLFKDGHTVHISNSDADCDIVTFTLESANTHEITVIIADDTDILIMLLYHYFSQKHNKIIFLSPASKRSTKGMKIIDISAAQQFYTYSSILPFIHAWSGCDTTSATFGHGKKKLLMNLKKNSEINSIAESFIPSDKTQEEIGKKGISLFKILYGCHENESLNNCRYKCYLNMIASDTAEILPEKLPPTEGAAYYHSLRVYLQVQQWITLGKQIMNPVNWGWKSNNDTLSPIMMDLLPAPAKLLKVMRCQCKSSTNQCGTKRCSCFKEGLKCSAACKECNGLDCCNKEVVNNAVHTIYDYFEDDCEDVCEDEEIE